MGDTTKPYQVVLLTFTKLAQGCVLATLKIERLYFHFQDRFEIRGCNTSRGPFFYYLSFFSIDSVNQRKTGRNRRLVCDDLAIPTVFKGAGT